MRLLLGGPASRAPTQAVDGGFNMPLGNVEQVSSHSPAVEKSRINVILAVFAARKYGDLP